MLVAEEAGARKGVGYWQGDRYRQHGIDGHVCVRVEIAVVPRRIAEDRLRVFECEVVRPEREATKDFIGCL